MIDLFIDALAVYRITRLVNEDVIFDRPRDAVIDWATKGDCTATYCDKRWAGFMRCERPGGHTGQHQCIVHRDTGALAASTETINWNDDDDGAGEPGAPARRVHPKVAEWVSCPWCVGVWVALLVVAARRAAPRVWGPVAKALAFSAVTGLIAEQT